MHRTKDLLSIGLHMKDYINELQGLELDQWLLDDNNIVLTTGEDYSLFEYDSPGVYYSHIFAKSGKATEFGKKSLQWMFDNGAEILKGLTPVEKRAAKIVARRIGFKAYGEIETSNGRCEIFIITKKEWEDS